MLMSNQVLKTSPTSRDFAVSLSFLSHFPPYVVSPKLLDSQWAEINQICCTSALGTQLSRVSMIPRTISDHCTVQQDP